MLRSTLEPPTTPEDESMAPKLPLRACIVAFSLALMNQPSSAETPSNPWYVGIGAGSSNISVFNPVGLLGSWEEGPDRSSWSLQGGYRLSRRFAVEVATLNVQDLAWQGSLGFSSSDGRFDVSTTEVAAIGVFSFDPRFEVQGRLGLAHYDLSGAQTVTSAFENPAVARSQPIAESGRGFLMGAGVGVNLTPSWSLRLDYQSFYIDSSFLGASAEYDDATIDTLSLVASYRFGGNR